MRQIVHDRTGAFPVRLMVALLALTTVALVAGCDRTRPYGATEEPTARAETPAPASTPTATAPTSGMAGPPVKTADGWKFTYLAPGASSVSLAGSFNDWNTGADPMTKGDNGVWSVVKKLDPGSYQYKFVINGTDWKEDPDNPETADDGYGGKNSLLVVS